MKTRMRLMMAAFALVLAIGASAPAFTQVTSVPPLMNFQGRLAKPDGTPLPDGTYGVLFSFYDALTNGNLQWSESRNVTVHNGTFSVQLGTLNVLNDSVFAGNRWLELKIGNDPPLKPRQQIVSVGFAFKADVANTVPDGSVTLSKLANGVLNFANISGTVAASQYATGTIPLTALAGNPLAALGKFSTGPSLLSSLGTGSSPYNVAAANGVACVAAGGVLQVFNVSNPAAPTLAGAISVPGQPFSVALASHYAYVVSSLNIPGLPAGAPNMFTFLSIVDISNPAAPTLVGTAQLYGIPTPQGLPSVPIAVSGNVAYIADALFNMLFTINISNPASPAVAGSVATGTGPRSVAVSGSNAYVVNVVSNTLQVFNVSNPASPVLTGHVATGAAPVSIAILGSSAYVTANGANTLQVFNITNPAAPALVGSVATGSFPNTVAVTGINAYVVNGGANTLQTFNVSNPAAPVSTQTTPTGSGLIGLAIAGSIAYITDLYSNELQIYDLNGTTVSALQVSGNLSVGALYGIDDLVRVFGGLEIDENSEGSGSLTDGLRFGKNSGEGIASNRQTGGANAFGLDFYTANIKRMGITNSGVVTVNGGLNSSTGNGNTGIVGSSASGTGISAYSTSGTGLYATGGNFAAQFDGAIFADNLKSGGTVLHIAPNPILGVGVGVGDLAPYGQAFYETNSSVPVTHAYFAENGIGVFSVAAGGATVINSTLTVNGAAQVHTINVIGGSDVAEPYQVAPAGKIKPLPGMVVVMNAAHIGQMQVATKAYDGTVGGIISGANGINPGITLTQKGTIADGSLPIASVGRVWCWCDADANGPITLGSLLTTSNTPGYAMRVTNFNRANGAIIGKAMSPLKHGRGLVLVMVSLK